MCQTWDPTPSNFQTGVPQHTYKCQGANTTHQVVAENIRLDPRKQASFYMAGEGAICVLLLYL